MDEGRRDESSELPWSFVFDPLSNARALGDVQRRGLHAAGQLVDRLVSSMDAAPPPAPGPDGAPRPSSPDPSNIADLPVIGIEFMSRLLGALTQFSGADGTGYRAPAGWRTGSGGASPNGAPADRTTADRTTADGTDVWSDVVTGRVSGALHLVAAAPGCDPVPGTVWLQNPGAADVGAVRLHAGELRTPDGAVLAAGALAFDPELVDALPARSARGVVVTACGVEDAAAGIFRGVVQAAGAPEVAVTVHVLVEAAPESDRHHDPG